MRNLYTERMLLPRNFTGVDVESKPNIKKANAKLPPNFQSVHASSYSAIRLLIQTLVFQWILFISFSASVKDSQIPRQYQIAANHVIM